jgi:hypothetical protein
MQTQEEVNAIYQHLSDEWGIESGPYFHLFALILLVIASLIVLRGQKSVALAAMLSVIALIPLRNRVDILGFNFFAARILLVVLWVRILIRQEHRGFVLLPVDKALLWFVVASSITSLMASGLGELAGIFGKWFDFCLGYFGFRILISDLGVFRRTLPFLAVLVVLLAVLMSVEVATVRNPLHFMGAGYGETAFVRQGRVRAQVAFGHPILAGTFGAVLLPYFLALACSVNDRRAFGLLGVVGSLLIVYCSASSGPAIAVQAAVIGMALWKIRSRMQLIRWGLVAAYIAADLVMKAPAYALIWRLSVVGGSSSYQRYELIDAFIKHFGEWWLCGTPSTAHWGYFTFDLTNQFVAAGVTGGIATLAMFIYFIARCFMAVGQGLDHLAETHDGLLLWSLGASVFVSIASFFGVSYFDQMKYVWLFSTAACSCAAGEAEIQDAESTENEATAKDSVSGTSVIVDSQQSPAEPAR